MQIANDVMPHIKDLSAIDRAYRAISFTTERVAERAKLLDAGQREARAAYYDERAASYVSLAKLHPAMMEFAGLNMLAANIMRAEVMG